MGGGSYSYIDSHARSYARQCQSREEIFSQRKMDAQMDIHGKIREACDSEEHPESFPIILALDVTGSMGMIPEKLIKGIFPEIMKSIAEQGVQHAQVCFVGFGDHYTDDAPFQAGQFETSDALLDKWLKLIWLEGGGGGNGGESPLLVYYFASRHTACDHIRKRHQKGVLITISDERTHPAIDRTAIQHIFGTTIETEQITAEQLLDEVKQGWDIYHFCFRSWSAQMQHSPEQWIKLLNGRGTGFGFDSASDLQRVIPEVIVETYKKGYPTTSPNPSQGGERVDTQTGETQKIML